MQKSWNIPDLPVYSLATVSNGHANMNICTYVSKVSLHPKIFSIAVYNNTKTLQNVENSELCVLQLLHKSHLGLVNKLGRCSGFTFDKYEYLSKKKLLMTWQNFFVIKNCCALILLQKLNAIQSGDHKLFLFEVIKSKSYSTDYLNLNLLREKKIIRG